MTDDALKSEILNDPASLGYAGKSPALQAQLLNSLTGPGSGTIARKLVSNTDPAMRAMLAGAWKNVRSSNDASLKQDYNTLITLVGQIGSVTPGDANTQAVIAQAIADGIVSLGQVAAVSSRVGSRAEVLWGDGTIVEWIDIARVMNA